jgi:phosphotransferase system  glucose/maltose/N-acetylglucosamine-specific IIC component
VPNVNGEVNFFDGCNWLLVVLVYVYVILFSVVYNVFKKYCLKKQQDEEKEKKEKDKKK